MAAADKTTNTQPLQRFIGSHWQHQQKNEFCDLTTNNTSIECHKLVLSSVSSYFSQLLCDPEQNINIIDVSPLPEHILRTVVAFMYNSEYVIDCDNATELLKLGETWNLDNLAMLCVKYITDNISINNACILYKFAMDNVDQHTSQIVNKFIREHFTSLYESGQLRQLSLKNFTAIIEHDEINVNNEDVIFSSAVQIINQQTSVEDITRCLELIRFAHTSRDFLVEIIQNHPLMKDAPRDKYPREALLYQLNNISTQEVKPPRYWGTGIYYIDKDHSMHQYVSKTGTHDYIKMTNIPGWVKYGSSSASHRERALIVGGYGDAGERALLLDMQGNTKVTQLPNLPESCHNPGVVLTDNDVYVVGGCNNKNSGCLISVHYLSLGGDVWQAKKSMTCAVYSPLVIQHQQCVYVLGGYNNGYVSSVSQYNIEDDTWKQCSSMPVACRSLEAGVVVHENRIKVITVDTCFVYDDDTDTWAVKQYNRLGHAIKAFVRRGQIFAAVQNIGTHSMMSYDDSDNVWKTEHERIDNALFFC